MMNLRPALDAIWLGVLAIYVLAGVAITPFHGDEAMQITMSRDYFTAFVKRQPELLPVSPPYAVDTDPWLRLINGSINRYGIGLSLQVAGYSEGDLPGLWQWPLSVEDNVARGSRPTQAVLNVSRISSALFLALSVPLLFAIGWQLAGRPTAFIASGLYALHPVLLLNGRRAMMEGSLLFFGLLTIMLAVLIGRGHKGWRLWLALGVASGLTLASKHSGVVFVAGAWGWIVLYDLFNMRLGGRRIKPVQKRDDTQVVPYNNASLLPKRQHRLATLTRLGMAALGTVLVFIALSPALWNDPVARLGDLVTERQKLLESQVTADPNGATTLPQRLEGIITQPFLTSPAYYEAAFWGNSESVRTEIARYSPSPLGGWQWGELVGATLTGLAGLGILAAIRNWRGALLVWLGVTVLSLLLNPLPWQRYYLPLYPIAALLAAMGITVIYRWIHGWRSST
jgi:Dolichyl-phosphate-mannose-protein mannosyltransferase